MYRIGKSTDIHQLVEKRPLILGGVTIESEKGLLGHSDADVLYHAIAESILGALGLDDLGTHFPDTSLSIKNISSSIIMKKVYEMMDQRGYEINNLDALIIIEKPKLREYIDKMKENVATLLHTSKESINIKATRGEKLGFIGKEEGALAECVVLIKSKQERN